MMNIAKHATLAALTGLTLGTAGLTAASSASAKEVVIWAWDPSFNIAIMKEAANRSFLVSERLARSPKLSLFCGTEVTIW